MKARLTLFFFLLATCLCSVAKDSMKITFNDAATVTYDVETITDITFIDSGNDPVTPPAPSDKVLVTRINDAVYTYDAQGRCTSMTSDGGDISLTFDYTNMSVSIYGFTVGSFTLTPQGNFSTISFNFMGAKSGMKFEYNSDGYVVKISNNESDDDYYYESENTFYWDNNLLTKLVTVGIEKDYDGEIKINDVFTLNYSQQENKTNQWTLAMFDSDFDLAVTGMFGNAPALLPSSAKWDSDPEFSVSYTLNPDGSIKTETFKGTTYNYYYASGASAAPAKDRFSKLIHRLSNKIAKR